MNNSEIMNDIMIESPCDLFGVNARKFRSAAVGAGSRVTIAKDDESICDASSLLGLLALRVKKGDRIRLVSSDKQQDLRGIVSTLYEIAS